MLDLNENSVRKGKPVGMPYVGSKKKVSKKIVKIIEQNFGKDKPVYDLFGGGAAITAELAINGFDVVYNELDASVFNMLQKIFKSDDDFLKSLITYREDFFTILKKDNKTTEDSLRLLTNSFGSNGKNYIYSKSMSNIKTNSAINVIKNMNILDNYKKNKLFLKLIESKTLKSDERLEQLERLKQLKRINDVNIENVSFYNKSYEEFSNIKNSIIYLDPPYINTTYNYDKNEFDYKKLYDYAYEMSKDNIVIMSEYNVPDDRFEVVYRFGNARSTFSPNSYGDKVEKLFMAKK